MRRILHATVVCLVALPGAGVAQPDWPIPQDAERQARRHEEMLAWNRKTLGEAYEKVGKKNPKWDELARKCLDAASRWCSHYIESRATLLDVHNRVQPAIGLGCDDPLILYLYARSSHGPFDPGRAELARRYAVAAVALEQSEYPAIRRFTALYKAGQYQAMVPRKDAEAERFLLASLRVLAESATHDEPSRDLEDTWYTAVTTVQGTLAILKKNSLVAFQQIDAELAKTPQLEWLRLAAKGDFYIHYAWEARGSGFADTVGPEAQQKFEARLKIARQALGQAWLVKPGDWHIANSMLTVVKGLTSRRDEMEKWFYRAMLADGDNQKACWAKLDWLDPKWYGTDEEMVAFGRACRDTKNVRSGITILLGDAHYRAMTRRDTKTGQLQYMRQDDVWNDIYSVYSEYFQLYPSDFRERTRFAVFACWAGRYEISQRQFLLLGDNIQAGWGCSEKDIREIRDFVARESTQSPFGRPKFAAAEATSAPPKSRPQTPRVKPSADRSAEFSTQKFRYNLPGPDWSWGEKPTPETLLLASNKRGLSVTVMVHKHPQSMTWDEQSAATFERGFLQAAGHQVKKRGGRLTTFQGLQCLQIEAIFDDRRTTVSRILQANGFFYTITVAGDKQPVERNPDFERIMSGFQFTEPPVTTWDDTKAPLNADFITPLLLGVFGCLAVPAAVGICGMIILIRHKRRVAPAEFDVSQLRQPLVSPTQHTPEYARAPDALDAGSSPREELDTPERRAAEAARKSAQAAYRRGMKDLGWGLIIYAALQFCGAPLILTVLQKPFAAVVVGGMAVLHLALGVLALLEFAWVNSAVCIWASVLLALNLIGVMFLNNNPAGALGGCFGFIIAGTMLYFSIKNVGALQKAR